LTSPGPLEKRLSLTDEARQPGAMLARSDTPRPTLAEMRQAAPWLWLWCRNVDCGHKAPKALAPLIIR